MINLASENSQGGGFAAYSVAATGAATSPTGTYSATSGPDSTPGLTLAASGTSGGVQANYTAHVEGEVALLLSCVIKASSTTPTLQPILCTFEDANGNTVTSYAAPAAAAAASTNAIQYQAVVAVPVGAVKAVVNFVNLAWSATGGYTAVLSSPIVGVL